MTDIQNDEPMRLADVVSELQDTASSNYDTFMRTYGAQSPWAKPISEKLTEWGWNPVKETIWDIGSSIRQDIRGFFSTSEDIAEERNAPTRATEVQVAADRASKIQEERRQSYVQFDQLTRDIGRQFRASYEEAVQRRQSRMYQGVPLGFVEGQYQPQIDSQGQVVGYTLNEWYRNPMEIAAHRMATQSAERTEAELRVGGQYARAFASPEGISMLERRTMGSEYESPYLTEDTVETDLSAIQVVARMTTGELGVLKNRLIRVGLLDPDQAGTDVYADRTPATYQAFLDLVYKAQENGKRWEPFLDEALAAGVDFGQVKGKGGNRAAQLIRLTAKDDLAAVFNQTAQRTIGRRLSQEEEDHLVRSYHDLERQFWQVASSGGEVQEPTSADVFADQQLQELQPDAYSVVGMGKQLDNFRAIVLGQA